MLGYTGLSFRYEKFALLELARLFFIVQKLRCWGELNFHFFFQKLCCWGKRFFTSSRTCAVEISGPCIPSKKFRFFARVSFLFSTGICTVTDSKTFVSLPRSCSVRANRIFNSLFKSCVLVSGTFISPPTSSAARFGEICIRNRTLVIRQSCHPAIARCCNPAMLLVHELQSFLHTVSIEIWPLHAAHTSLPAQV